jgi:hypothetical protein
MTPKLRVVRQGCPSFAVPGFGTVRVPAVMAALAAWKNATALQAPTWVNEENAPAMSSPATQLFCCRIASGVPDAAGTLAAAGGAVPVTAGAVTEPAVAVAAAVAVACAWPSWCRW